MRVFTETQKFTQWWVKLINLSLLVLLGYAFYNWFVLDQAFGNVSEENKMGQAITSLTLLFSAVLIYSFKLKTNIDEVGLHYQFRPFNWSIKTVRWSELKKCYVRTYNPLKEYGGWGYRNPFSKNKALNVKGNKGIQLEFKDGEKLLLGTQKEDDAQKLLERYFKTKDE